MEYSMNHYTTDDLMLGALQHLPLNTVSYLVRAQIVPHGLYSETPKHIDLFLSGHDPVVWCHADAREQEQDDGLLRESIQHAALSSEYSLLSSGCFLWHHHHLILTQHHSTEEHPLLQEPAAFCHKAPLQTFLEPCNHALNIQYHDPFHPATILGLVETGSTPSECVLLEQTLKYRNPPDTPILLECGTHHPIQYLTPTTITWHYNDIHFFSDSCYAWHNLFTNTLELRHSIHIPQEYPHTITSTHPDDSRIIALSIPHIKKLAKDKTLLSPFLQRLCQSFTIQPS